MIGSLESGTATDNSGERSLQDASKNWPKDLWKDKRVRISDGSGKDEINVIQSNTNDTLVFAQAWQKRPDKSSKYDIIDFYEKDTTPDTAPSIHKILEAKARIIATLDAELKLTKTELAAVKAALAKHEADWNQGKFDTLFNKQFKDLEDGYKGRIAKAEEKAIDAQKQFDVKNKELNDFIQTNALKEKDLTAKHETEKKGWEKERQELKLSVASGGGTAGDPKVKMGASDEINEPRGNIVRAEANGETVIIDLGSDHKVVAQLTFAVHGMGTGGKPLRDPKAKIEVISVLSKDQSLARVTRMYKPENARDTDNPENEKNWIKDPRDFWRVRNPILKGDVIYNPAWRPNRKVHIALNGVFDLDGDGKEDFATLRKLLEERGAVIDAWLDPEGGKYDKRGELTAKTEFVVVGVRPPMILNPREGEPKPEFKDGFEKLELRSHRPGHRADHPQALPRTHGLYRSQPAVRQGRPGRSHRSGEKRPEGSQRSAEGHAQEVSSRSSTRLPGRTLGNQSPARGTGPAMLPNPAILPNPPRN